MPESKPKLIVFCTVNTGLDAVAAVMKQGYSVEAIVGVNPVKADPLIISGWTDVQAFAAKWNIRYIYVDRYDLKSEKDQEKIKKIDFDLVWVAGWQRLVPEWLITMPLLGVLGGHGSPDGIYGGRGRSPQNWAILLGCKRFDLALFQITTGVDDGPVVAERSFFYNETDDISVSYKKASLCMASMMVDVLTNPSKLKVA